MSSNLYKSLVLSYSLKQRLGHWSSCNQPLILTFELQPLNLTLWYPQAPSWRTCRTGFSCRLCRLGWGLKCPSSAWGCLTPPSPDGGHKQPTMEQLLSNRYHYHLILIQDNCLTCQRSIPELGACTPMSSR